MTPCVTSVYSFAIYLYGNIRKTCSRERWNDAPAQIGLPPLSSMFIWMSWCSSTSTWLHLADLFGSESVSKWTRGERDKAREKEATKDTRRSSQLPGLSHSVTLTCCSRESGWGAPTPRLLPGSSRLKHYHRCIPHAGDEQQWLWYEVDECLHMKVHWALTERWVAALSSFFEGKSCIGYRSNEQNRQVQTWHFTFVSLKSKFKTMKRKPHKKRTKSDRVTKSEGEDMVQNCAEMFSLTLTCTWARALHLLRLLYVVWFIKWTASLFSTRQLYVSRSFWLEQ